MKFKNILLVIIFILFLSVYMAVKTKLSYINDVDINKCINEINTKLYISSYEEDITEVFTLNESVIEVSDLENISPIIVKVKVNPIKERRRFYLCTLTNVEVIEVYNGEVDENNIDIFEPIDISINKENGEIIVDSLDGYNWMKESKEYILFLRPLKDSNYSNNESVYLPTTTLLSKYEISNNKAENLNINELVNYYDIRNEEIFTDNYEIINKFNYFKDNIMKIYK